VTRTLTFRLPEYRTLISCEHATWIPLRLRGPTLPRPLRDFADRGILAPSPLLLESPTSESPILRIRATCPSRNRRFRSNRGIALRDFNVHEILALANPDSPIHDGHGFLRCLRVNTLSPSSRSNDPLDSAGLHDDSVRRFSSSTKRSPLHHLPSV
jgi:hypothetical protein